jgi:hypothetical protein
MQNGDLSNHVAPRLLLVFEGALGFCTDRPKYDKAARKGRWEEAAGYWERNELCCRRILWLYHRKDVAIEIVTFLGEPFAAELKYWLDSLDLPIHRVWATTPENLQRNIEYMPDLACVYDPEPRRWLMYGGKGRYLTDINKIGEGL